MKIVLMGLELNIGNLGCEALTLSCLNILKRSLEECGKTAEISAICYSQDVPQYISDSYFDIELVSIRPKSTRFWTDCSRLIKESDIIIDYTAGDSFSDIYGMKRYMVDGILKSMAIRSGKRFVLGPQTYGPFYSKLATRMAQKIIKGASVVYTRDKESQDYVRELCGVTPILTTDIAFALPYESKEQPHDKINLGINISGLIWSGGYTGKNQFGLTVDYEKYIRSILEKYSNDDRYRVHIIPHVGHIADEEPDSDVAVSKMLMKEYPNCILAHPTDTCLAAKNYIAGMDVFTGARMHSTIGAFSSGVPTIPFSYSRKFEGLYQSLNYPYTISAREISTDEAIELTFRYIENFKELDDCRAESMKIVEEYQRSFAQDMIQLLSEV